MQQRLPQMGARFVDSVIRARLRRPRVAEAGGQFESAGAAADHHDTTKAPGIGGPDRRVEPKIVPIAPSCIVTNWIWLLMTQTAMAPGPPDLLCHTDPVCSSPWQKLTALRKQASDADRPSCTRRARIISDMMLPRAVVVSTFCVSQTEATISGVFAVTSAGAARMRSTAR